MPIALSSYLQKLVLTCQLSSYSTQLAITVAIAELVVTFMEVVARITDTAFREPLKAYSFKEEATRIIGGFREESQAELYIAQKANQTVASQEVLSLLPTSFEAGVASHNFHPSLVVVRNSKVSPILLAIHLPEEQEACSLLQSPQLAHFLLPSDYPLPCYQEDSQVSFTSFTIELEEVSWGFLAQKVPKTPS